MRYFKFTGLLMVCVAFFTSLACADPNQSPPLQLHPVVKKQEINALQAPQSQLNHQKQIWNLKDADIRAVIQTISLLTGKNFIIDPQVDGKITLVSQQPMTPDEMYHVFLSMLQVLGYSAISSGNVIKIVPAMNAKEYGGLVANKRHPGVGDQVVVRIVPVNNISAVQLVPVLRPLMQEWGSVTAYTPTNSLILAGAANNIKRLVKMVHKMDNPNANRIDVVKLQHANAQEIVKVINDLQMSDRSEGKVANVSIVADAANNSILVSGNLSNQIEMRNLIRRLDTANNNGGNTAVIHLNYLQAKKLAPLLTKIVGGNSSTSTASGNDTSDKVGGVPETSNGNPAISIQAETSDNAIIIHAPMSVIQDLKKVIHRLDVRPSEVLVQAIVVKIDESLMNQLGVIWSSVNSQGVQTAGNNSVALQVGSSFGLIQDGNLQALVHFLMQHGSTDILATPSIVVLNNQTASIDDGKNIGIINRQYATNVTGINNLAPAFNTIERKDVTLSLKVTPQISPNEMLRLKIDQEDDEVDRANTTSPDNPVINTSKIKTNVLVQSGDILVLGGLLNNDQQNSYTKIPILGDIPLLGRLFRYKNNEYEKKDLMVFIRPIILGTNWEAKRETLRNYNYIRKEQIQSLSGRRLTQDLYPSLPIIAGKKLLNLPPPAITLNHGK